MKFIVLNKDEPTPRLFSYRHTRYSYASLQDIANVFGSPAIIERIRAKTNMMHNEHNEALWTIKWEDSAVCRIRSGATPIKDKQVMKQRLVGWTTIQADHRIEKLVHVNKTAKELLDIKEMMQALEAPIDSRYGSATTYGGGGSGPGGFLKCYLKCCIMEE